MMPIAIFLCSKTANAAEPWAAAGVECFCVDVQHSIRKPRREGLINFVWGDARSWRPPEGRRVVFVAAFPPCTHVAGSGARDFATKGPIMLRDALETFEACRQAAAWSGAPYYIENPVGVLSSIPHIGKPQHWFHPSEYAGYADEPASEAYTKKTGLWTGNGFIMPDRKPVEPTLGSMMHRLPPTDDRADLRSATPKGFSRAVMLANIGQWARRVAA
jgi:hypothetical protein